MFNRIIADLNKDKIKRAILISGAFLILVGFALYIFRAMGQNLSGEAYYDFQYPYLNPMGTSWKLFFLDRIRSRLLHGIFISILYHVFGYNPSVFYLAILCMVVLIAVLIAISVAD
ncbi:MAG TPA: hypothetical protein VLK33_09385, partial [Terriglobales bacterium]|nr:hypothetical protein [Terriglobales bacterium]